MELLPDPAVDIRNGGYYVAGTRVSLDSVVWALRRGESAEQILSDLPALGSRDRLEQAISFVRSYPALVDRYLAVESVRQHELRRGNPPSLVRKAQSYRTAAARKPA